VVWQAAAACCRRLCKSTATDLEELGATQVEEEVRQVGEAGGPPEAGWVVLCEVPKLGGHPDEYPVYPA